MKSRRSIAALLFFLAIISSVSLALFSCTGEETGSGVTEPEYDIPSGAILGKGVETAIIANYEVGTNTEIYLRKVYDEVILKMDDFPFVGADTNPQAEHELVFGDTSRDITLQAKRLLSDKITSDSPAIFGEDYDEDDVIGYAIYAQSGSVAVVWNDIHAEEKAYERFLGSCFSEDYLVL